MKQITATTLRRRLFHVLAETKRSVPTRVRYRRGDAVVVSYKQYHDLLHRKRGRKRAAGLQPLVEGKIHGTLGDPTGKTLMRYMGLK